MSEKPENADFDHLAVLSELAEREADAAEALDSAEAATDRAVAEARRARIPWVEVARALGEPQRRAQWRLERLERPVRSKADDQVPRVGERHDAFTSSPHGTVTVTRAAELLQFKSRRKVYELLNRNDEPRLDGVRLPSGRTRVTLESIARYLGVSLESLEGEIHEDTLPVLQVADRLGVSRTVVSRLIAEGVLEIEPDSSPARVRVKSVEEYLRQVDAGSESLPVSTAAEALDVSRTVVRRLMDEGKLDTVKLPGRPDQVAAESVQKWVEREKRLEGWLTVAEVAEAVGVSKQKIYRAVRDGGIVAVEDLAGRLRFDSESIKALK